MGPHVMIQRRFLLAAVSALSLALPFVPADRPVAEETELGAHMEAINGLVRGMRKGIADEGARDENLAKLAELQGHILAAKGLTPAKATGLGEAEMAEFMDAYRVDTIGFLQAALEIELAVTESRFEDAGASFKALQKLKNPSHKKYKAKK